MRIRRLLVAAALSALLSPLVLTPAFHAANVAPRLLAVSPADGATAVPVDRVLTAYFNEGLNPVSLSASAVQVTDKDGHLVPVAVQYEAGQQAVAILPIGDLSPRTVYTVRYQGITDSDGVPVKSGAWSFTTGSAANQVETELADSFTALEHWTWWSDLEGAVQKLVSAPAAEGGSGLALWGSSSDHAFDLSHIRDVQLMDENSAIRFDYQVTGSSRPKSLALTVTVADGRTFHKAFLEQAVPVGGWQHLRIRLADVAPELVGQAIDRVAITEETATPGTARFVIANVRMESDLGQYAAIPPTTALGQDHSLDSGRLAWVSALAAQIGRSQQPDGSLAVGPPEGGTRIVPYFANFTALGQLRAYQVTENRQYLQAAEDWLHWYEAHLNTDGTVNDYKGIYPRYVNTGDMDSVDSYAATYLLAAWKDTTVQSGTLFGDTVARRYPSIRKVYGALDSVYLADGLTMAKPSAPAQYLMDNVETWLGLVADAKLSSLEGDLAQAKLASYLAMRTRYALRNRFQLADAWYYAMAVYPDGRVRAGMKTWYPDALANVMLLAVLGEPTEADRTLMRRLVAQVDEKERPDRPASVVDTLQYTWWAMAALQLGDRPLADHFVEEYLATEGSFNPATLAVTAGQLIRIETYSWDQSLWF